MTVGELLDDLAAKDIRFSVAGDRLLIDAPKGAMTLELRSTLADRKAEVLGELRRRELYEVPEGWSPKGWADRLSYLSDRCIHPGRAAERGQADG